MWKERINIKEKSLKLKSEIDSVIFRKKFEEYRDKYLDKQNEIDLIFVFIFLQIHLEYFLHQNMRRIIDFEFSNNAKKIKKWQECEQKNIKDTCRDGKVNEGKLTLFINMFFDVGEEESAVSEHKRQIEENYKSITGMRNNLIHGHELSETTDAVGNVISISSAQKILTQQNFSDILNRANKLCECWNMLLDILFLKCKQLRIIEDFKFKFL